MYYDNVFALALFPGDRNVERSLCACMYLLKPPDTSRQNKIISLASDFPVVAQVESGIIFKEGF